MEAPIQSIIANLKDVLTNENFVVIGSTRKAFKYKQFVLKTYVHEIGYLQT